MKQTPFIYVIALCFCHLGVAANQPENIGTDLQAQIQHHSESLSSQPFSWQEITQKPSLDKVKLAPDGKSLIYLLQEDRGRSLWLMNIAKNQHEKLLHSLLVTDVYWSSDSQLVFISGPDNMAYIKINETPRRPEMFVQFDEAEGEAFYAIDDHKSGHILMLREIKEHGKNKQHQLIRVGLDGEEQLLFSGAKRIYDHLFDSAGNLAFIRYAGEEKHEIHRLEAQKSQRVFTSMAIDKVRMVRFDESNDELILVAFHDADLVSLHAYHIETGQSRVLHQDPEQMANLSGLRLDSESNEVLLASYFTDRMKTYAVHPAMEQGMAVINNSLNGSLLVGANKSTPYWLVRQSGSTMGHPRYHLYDVSKNQLQPVLTAQRNVSPGLSESHLSEAVPVSYTASDGMLIHGYVVLPKGVDLQQVPLLVYVHGGPYNRMHGGYSPWQYLVNQGYALFMPNFRASAGYGVKYMTAAKAEFSGRVQKDIIEGVNYLLSQGISQPERVGVFGHSFGGYSVLSLLSSYPDFFQAGFASAAPTELLSTLFKMDQKDINRYDGVPLIAALSILMVDPDNEAQKQRMGANSPARLWQNINKPLFIWAGELDQRVPIVDVKDHASKLKQAGKPVELLVDRKTGHNFHKDNLVGQQAYRFLIEDFFAQHFNKTRPKPSRKTQEYIEQFKVY